MSRVPITKDGEISIKEKLSNLKFVERPQISQAIAEARAHGDLKENAEYHAAKEQQSLTEARIKDIEIKLSIDHIIDISNIEPSDKVIFGTTVTVFNSEIEKSIKYKIVGEDEADATSGKISFASPLAKSLIGKFEGDSTKVETPSGVVEYEIEKVDYV